MRRGELKEDVHHLGPVVVTCAACAKSVVVEQSKRNDRKFVGVYCDGPFGARHLLVKMLGPGGEVNR